MKDDSGTRTGSPRSSRQDAFERRIKDWTDHYFLKSKRVVEKFGDVPATYAIFMRRPVIFAPRLAVDWLREAARLRGADFDIDLNFQEGDWAGAGEPLMYITGPLVHLMDLETLLLQKLGSACVAANNACAMVSQLPGSAFMAMDARHCAGTEMADLMAYAASVGSAAAKRQQPEAAGFAGNATKATARYFGNENGLGTMPHALIGYAGSTLRAAEMFAETFPDEPITVLVDYFGREVSDALAVAERFSDLVEADKVAFRLDTHGGRYIEGLGPQESYAVLEKHAPLAVRRYRNETELRYLTGTGVSAAAVFRFRDALDGAGYQKARIVCSSGFDVEKCRVMADVNAPIDVIGTGSFLPKNWTETYATADIISYGAEPRVKAGREFLLKRDGGA